MTRAPTDVEFEDQSILAIASEGRKDDSAKPRMDLIPPELLLGVADVLTYGAAKYAPRNWEKGMSWGRVFGAMMRHMWAWWAGQRVDPESGLPHLHHAACCVAFLMAYEARGSGTDDRHMAALGERATIPNESLPFDEHVALRDAERAKHTKGNP